MSATTLPRILHVVERFGGGLGDAIMSFAATTPQFEHHILAAMSVDVGVDDGSLDGFASWIPLPEGHRARIDAVRAAAHSLNPVAVHSHSSYAGVYTRLALRKSEVPLLYSPHSLPTERGDISPFERSVFGAIEFWLARNTSMFLVCSRRELWLTTAFGSRAEVRYIDNVARPVPLGLPQPNDDEFVVTGVGRVAAQKSPEVFARVAREVRERMPWVRFVWVGGGDAAREEELRAAGVEVTGWVSRDETLRRVAASHLYLHTAEWEGFPISLLESVALGVPSLVRDRPYAIELPRAMVATDSELSTRVMQLLDDEWARSELLATGWISLSDHTPLAQGMELTAAYSAVAGMPNPTIAAIDAEDIAIPPSSLGKRLSFARAARRAANG